MRLEASGAGSGPTVLVVNAASREGEAGADAVRAALERHGLRVDSAHVVSDPAGLAVALRAAVGTRPARLIVAGGDGTLSAAANVLAGTGVALGVVPLGTGNDFARNLRLPRDLDAACAVAAGGEARAVNVAVANGRVFLNALSLGISSAVARRLTPELKRRAGPLAYPLAAAGEVLAPEPFRVSLRIPGGRRELDALQVVVGNGRYHGGGTLVAPGATLADDRLDVYVIRSAAPPGGAADSLRNSWLLARVGLLLRRGRHLEHPNVVHLRCREVAIDAAPPQEVDLDGELLGNTPVECRAAPGLLRVITPRARRPESD